MKAGSAIEFFFMRLLDPLLPVLQQLGGLVLLACCIVAWGAMDPRTRNCYRLAYGLVGMGGAGILLAPAFGLGTPELAQTAVIAGFALYMVLDRRRIRHTKEPT